MFGTRLNLKVSPAIAQKLVSGTSISSAELYVTQLTLNICLRLPSIPFPSSSSLAIRSQKVKKSFVNAANDSFCVLFTFFSYLVRQSLEHRPAIHLNSTHGTLSNTVQMVPTLEKRYRGLSGGGSIILA